MSTHTAEELEYAAQKMAHEVVRDARNCTSFKEEILSLVRRVLQYEPQTVAELLARKQRSENFANFLDNLLKDKPDDTSGRPADGRDGEEDDPQPVSG